MNTSIALDSSRKNSEDRGEIVQLSDCLCLAVTDGAGGISGGADAADIAMEIIKRLGSFTSKAGCAGLFAGMDGHIFEHPIAGETTGVMVLLKDDQLVGVSVGDSGAWLFTDESREELTRGQPRKPLLGSGSAMPHLFFAEFSQGTLVVATDGLWKYAKLEAIQAVIKECDPADLAKKLIDLSRLKSGALPDDICVITCTVP